MKVGDEIEVMDRRVAVWPMRGVVLELDEYPVVGMGESFAKIRVESVVAPAPEVWVNLRLAKVVKEA